MNISDYCRMYRTPLPPELVYAGEYLEARGYRLCIEFGTTNAISKATDLVIQELEEMV